MGYRMKVGEQHPGFLGFVPDGSGSMAAPWAGHQGSGESAKAAALANIVNTAISDLGSNCVTNEGGVKNRCAVALIGYEGGRAYPLWGGTLAGKTTVAIPDIVANPLGTATVTEERADPVEGTVEVQRDRDYWMTPQVGGGTPMGQGLKAAREAVEAWLNEPGHEDSFPPVVMHITDGMPDAGERQMALDEAEAIKALSTTDGNVLLVTVHIPDGYGQTIIFPADPSELPAGDDSAKLLYDMASTLPAELLESAMGAGLPVKPGSKLMIMNADASAAARLINWGSSAGVAR